MSSPPTLSAHNRHRLYEVNDDSEDDASECSSTADEAPSGYHRKSPASERRPSNRTRNNWKNVEQFEHEGYDYRLQRRPIERGSKISLAKREEQALALASTGMSRKEIAGSLGVTPSTVGVLLHRAAQKLGVASRRELIKSYMKRLSLASTPGSP